MLSKLKVYGELSEFCGGNDEFHAVIHRPIDAVNFLKANFKGLERHMSNQFYQVYIGEHQIDEELLDFPSGGLDIKIIPVVTGSGNVGRIIAGVALIGLAIINPTVGFGLGPQGLAGGFATASGAFSLTALAGNIGILLVISGVAGLLTPTPELPDDETDPIKSFSFSGVQQTTRAGTAIPVVYGKTLVGSIPISTKVETNDIEA